MVLEHNYRRQDKVLPYEVKQRIVIDLLQLASPLQKHKCHHCCQRTTIDTEPGNVTFDMLVERRNDRLCVNLGESMEIVRACEAAFELSYCYTDGFGTEISLSEALRWMKFAAENGLARAQAAVIPLYESAAQQIPADMPSLTWLYNGMMKGSFEASNHLHSLHPSFHTIAREVYLRCERGIGRSFWIDQNPDKIWPVGNLQSLVEVLSVEGFSKGQVRANDHYGDTLLHLAAATGYPETVLFLCGNFEHPVNAQNDLGETALLAACRSGRLSTVDILLAYGADATIASELNAVPLHWLMAFRSDEEATHVCERLLCSNLTIEIRSKPQQLTYESCTHLWFCGTPLHWAVTARNIIAVKALLLHEASPTSQNSRNETPLEAAAALNFHAAIKLMLPRCKDADLISLCRIATMEIPMFFHMLQFGASWKEKRVECITEFLGQSARTMDANFTNSLVGIVLQALPVNLLDFFLDAIQFQSIFVGEVDPPIEPLVNLILQSQYTSFLSYKKIYNKVGAKASNGARQLLKAAASVNDPRFIQQLLRSGMSPYDEIDDGLDAFGVAVMASSLKTADAILDFDNGRRLSNITPESESIDGEDGVHTLICRILSSNNGIRSSSVSYLIERIPDAVRFIAIPDKKGSVFHLLAAQVQSFHRPILTKDYKRVFRILLDHFANDSRLNALDISGETALHYAVEAVNFEAVVLLVQAGADPNHHGEGVDTALGKAFKILEGFLLKDDSRFELPSSSSKLGAEGKRIAEKRLEEIIELLRDHKACTDSELKSPSDTLTPSLGRHIDLERLHQNDWDYYMQSQDDTDLISSLSNTAVWEERMRNLYLSSK
jgi:ankyrin repeat protein